MNKLNSKRASLFFDSDEIKNYRKKGQNILQNDEVLAFFLFRSISIYFSAFIANKTNISANNITLAMSILGLFGVVFITLPKEIPYVILTALIYYLTTYFLDVIDGEVARLKGTTSKVGVILDASLWFYFPLAYTIAIYTLSSKLNIGIWLPTIVTVGVFHDIYCDMSIRLFDKKSVSAKQKPKTLFNVFKLVFSKPIYFLILLICWNIFNEESFKYFFISYSMLISVMYFTNSTINLIKLLKVTH